MGREHADMDRDNARTILAVLELLAAHLVEAPRDLSVDVLSRTSDWGRVLADLG